MAVTVDRDVPDRTTKHGGPASAGDSLRTDVLPHPGGGAVTSGQSVQSVQAVQAGEIKASAELSRNGAEPAATDADNVTRLETQRISRETPLSDASPMRSPQSVPPEPKSPASPPSGDAPPARPKNLFGWVLLQSARAVLPIVILAGAFAGYQYMKATKPAPAKQAPIEKRFTVQTQAAVTADIQPTVSVFGNAVAGREVQLRALVAGRVIDTSTLLKDGSLIERGETILKIDPFDYEAAVKENEAQIAEAKARKEELQASVVVEKANLEFAKQQLALAQKDLRRARTLSSRGNLSARSLDDRSLLVSQRQQSQTQMENNLRVLAARVRQQDATISRLSTTLSRNRQRLAETELKAPFTGYLTSVNAQIGRMVSSNDAVATLIDRGTMDIRFTLSDRQYGRLAAASAGTLEGRTVRATWDVGGKPVVYQAIIDRVAARVTSTTGGVDIFARVKDPSGVVPLRPGAFVEVSLADILFEDVVRVPASAVYDRSTVYVVVEDRLQKRAIEIVGSDGRDLLVKGDLKPGDPIATTRLSTPGTGVAVEVR
ncbi:MAG: efflux RND transporter periplasmic adaptor subunit [Pseudomonadota bacterium]